MLFVDIGPHASFHLAQFANAIHELLKAAARIPA